LTETPLAEAMNGNGSRSAAGVGAAIPLPQRSAPKGMLPSTWLNRALNVEYVDSFGGGVKASGTLLDLFPAGPVLNMSGARTLISWDRLVLCELKED
jgi:hypothetical protein